MRTNDLLQETYRALSANKVRSGLTMLGIIIGISSVIAMTAIGAGAQNSIQSSIQSIGSNLIIVMPGAARGGPGSGGVSSGRGNAKTLTFDDAKAIAEISSGVQAVAPEVSGRYQVLAKGANTNTSIVGTVSAYPIVRNINVESGSFITDQNVSNNAKVAVLGPSTRDDLFGEGADIIGQTIRINKITFRVIGVTVAKGGSGFSNPDDMIFIPITTAQRFLSGDEYVNTISVAAVTSEEMTQVQSDITDLLLDRHGINDPSVADFNILNQSDIIATASSVTSTFTVLLAAVAGISLVVGGIGIMNMMLTTVTERTREIGLRKAIGANRADISNQFLLEAIFLTMIGGGIGVALGWGIAYAVQSFGIVQTVVSVKSVVVAFVVSAVIGIVFGYYPARRAARLNPIEALRYE